MSKDFTTTWLYFKRYLDEAKIPLKDIEITVRFKTDDAYYRFQEQLYRDTAMVTWMDTGIPNKPESLKRKVQNTFRLFGLTVKLYLSKPRKNKHVYQKMVQDFRSGRYTHGRPVLKSDFGY